MTVRWNELRDELGGPIRGPVSVALALGGVFGLQLVGTSWGSTGGFWVAGLWVGFLLDRIPFGIWLSSALAAVSMAVLASLLQIHPLWGGMLVLFSLMEGLGSERSLWSKGRRFWFSLPLLFEEDSARGFLRPFVARARADDAIDLREVGIDHAPGLEQLLGVLGRPAFLSIPFLVFASAASGSPLPVLLGTSFVHYLIYMGTFEIREGVRYGQFVREAVFFRAVSMIQLAYWYVVGFEPNWVSLILIGTGFGLSMLASHRLGFVGTYFGAELGQIEPRWERSFPYGTIPHPMIVGNLIGLVGIGLSPELSERFPWLVPSHCALYLIHLVQEVRSVRVA